MIDRCSPLLLKGRTISEWAKELGLHPTTLRRRLDAGLSVEEILISDYRSHGGSRAKKMTFKGETMKVSEWAKKLGLCPATIHRRLKKTKTKKRVLSSERWKTGPTTG